MSKILIFAQDGNRTSTIRDHLSRGMPDVRVETAKSPVEATNRLLDARRAGLPYGAIILGPNPSTSRQDQADPSIHFCGLLPVELAHTLTVHLSHVPNSEQIVRHMQAAHGDPLHPRPAKSLGVEGDRWEHELLSFLKTFLYSRIVERQLDALFGNARPTGALMQGSISHELANLYHDVSTYWPYLHYRLQARIREKLMVDESTRPVRVGLL